VHDADVLRLLATQNRTYFKAGSNYRYSNSGYALLALIVGKASGQRFAAFLHDRIFQPLGMHATVAFEDGNSTVSNRAYGYSAAGNAWRRTDQSSTSAVLGDGGIYTSINDLAKWDAALYDDRLLSAESRQLAFTPATHTDNPSVDYGFGLARHRRNAVAFGRDTAASECDLRYSGTKLTIIVLTNRNDPNPIPPRRPSRGCTCPIRPPVIQNDAVVLGLLAATLGAIFWTTQSTRPFWQRFYKYIPALVLCYFVPAPTTRWIDRRRAFHLYFIASRYLLRHWFS
jgi:CubicO group peptidase (beta-lactamase class C family)